MDYYLRSLGSRTFVEITKSEFDALERAKRLYGHIIRIEENFDAVMEDYAELEQALLHLGVRYMTFSQMDHADFHSMRNLIVRKILHLLSTARLYRHALRKDGKAALDNDHKLALLNEEFADGPNKPMPFRIVEALRNYSQHEELPISSMSAGAKWEESEDKKVRKERASYTIVPKIDAVRVSEERKLAADVKAALKELGSNAEMITHIRKYIEHLGSIHAVFRKLSEGDEKNWKSLIRGAIDQYHGKLGKDGEALLVLAIKEREEKGQEQIQLFNEFFDYHDKLRRKNRSQINLSRRYVKWTALDPAEN